MSQQVTCILHMFCLKRTYVPRFILSLLYSFISSCCVELLLVGTFVDRRICLHKFLSIMNFNCFVLSKFAWNFFESEVSELNLCEAVCCLLRSFEVSELSQGHFGGIHKQEQPQSTSGICSTPLVHPWVSRCVCPGRAMQVALAALCSQAQHLCLDPAPQEDQHPMGVWWNYLLADLLPLLEKQSSLCMLWCVAGLFLSLPPVPTHMDFRGWSWGKLQHHHKGFAGRYYKWLPFICRWSAALN